MTQKIKVAVLGSTGYVGLELINILSNHPNVLIKFLGSDSSANKKINNFDNRISSKKLPILSKNSDINISEIDVVFLCLPHGISNKFVKKFFGKTSIIDLSADFRLDKINIYKKNYNSKHLCPNLLKKFIYGLPEINFDLIKDKKNVSIPGCYPTSILLPLVPLIQENIIKSDNIVCDSKSGYSGAGVKFDKNNLFSKNKYNFYNYNTNKHRHICEIRQELSKNSKSSVKFSFNPHILPIFRGMMTTIYCDLNKTVSQNTLKNCLKKFYSKSKFVKILKETERLDFFRVQNTNHCFITFFNHYDTSKIIIVSCIDNLLKGASGQAIQCMNIMNNLNDSTGLEKHISE